MRSIKLMSLVRLSAVLTASCLLAGCGSDKPSGAAADNKKTGTDKRAAAHPGGATPDQAGQPTTGQDKPSSQRPTTVDDKAKRITKANLDRIQLGMPEKEVRDLLGKPANESKAGAATILVWMEELAAISVTTEEGKVRSKRGDSLHPPIGPKLTQANFDKIKEGMTEKQVYDILGLPTLVEGTGNTLQLRWADSTDDPKFIFVSTEDGKVTVKSAEGLS